MTAMLSTKNYERTLISSTIYIHQPFIILAFFLLYVFAWFTQLSGRKEFFLTIRFEFILASLLVVLSFLAYRKLPKSGLSNFIIAYYIVVLLSFVLTHDSQQSWDIFINRILKFSFMGWFIYAFATSPRSLKYFILAFLAACFVITSEGLRGGLSGSMIWENQGVMRLHGSTPLYFHPNSLAGMAIGTLPFIYYLFPVLRNKYLKGALMLLFMTSLYCIIFAGSRTTYVGFIAMATFLFLDSKNKQRFFMYGILCAVILVFAIPAQYSDRFQTIFTGKDKEGRSIETRRQIFEDSVEVFSEYPLGVGVAAFPSVRSKKFGRSQDTHNLPMEIATNLGVQGIIVFGLLIFKMFRILFSVRSNLNLQIEKMTSLLGRTKRPPAREYQIRKHLDELEFMRAVCSSAILYLFVRLTLGMFGSDLYEVYWWLIAGLVSSLFSINYYAEKISGYYYEVPCETSDMLSDSAPQLKPFPKL